MADETITYRPPHCEDVVTTMTRSEFDLLFGRLISARGKEPEPEPEPLRAADSQTASVPQS